MGRVLGQGRSGLLGWKGKWVCTWSKNWHETFGENGFADGSSNTAQDTPLFFRKGCGNGGQVKCEHVSKQRFIL